MSGAAHPESPLARRLREMREMRAYWLRNCDEPTQGYGPDDPAVMLEHATNACSQVAGRIISEGVQPCAD